MKMNVINAIELALKKLKIVSEVELTEAKGHGDFSTNIAMKLVKELNCNPKEIAQKIIDKLSLKKFKIKKVEIAGPGFINFFMEDDALIHTLNQVDDKYGQGHNVGKINVEFISANPTGYLHMGHARNAALGDSLANILEFSGYEVDREYYINDAGSQIDVLGKAAYTRYLQANGIKVKMPENTYKGQDIVFVGEELKKKFKGKYLDKKYSEVQEIFKKEAKTILIKIIKEHLKEFNIEIPLWFSEQSLYDRKLIQPALEQLKDTFHEDGAFWLNTKKHGDDKNRVLVKSDGTYTYLAPDIAYHLDKFKRGYDKMINIWGADHSGYIKRLKVAVENLGYDPDKLEILTIQLVRLIKDGVELKMSKRLGTSYTLQEMIEETSCEAARFYLIDRSNNTKIDFNFNLVQEQNATNPIFYIQYAHARANQILEKSSVKPKLETLTEKNELNLINTINKFPELVMTISQNYKVHLMSQYLLDLAREFHSYYNSAKIIGSKNEASQLVLVNSVKQVIKNGLKLIGIKALERM